MKLEELQLASAKIFKQIAVSGEMCPQTRRFVEIS
jgi:hypothetical protein